MKISAQKKLENLEAILSGMGSAVLAYSGGTDSSFLLAVASSVLGRRLLAVTARSPTYPASELAEARRLARVLGARHVVVVSRELDAPRFRQNPPDRCYYCKKELFSLLGALAKSRGAAHLLDGTTTSDLADVRPGRMAALEAGVRSPLLEAGLSKVDVRELSRKMGLLTWKKPAMACLASRFPFGTEITDRGLAMVGKAEEALRKIGIKDCRVRYHGSLCRIETPLPRIGKLLRARKAVVQVCRRAGFRFVTIDLEGYIPAGKRTADPQIAR